MVFSKHHNLITERFLSGKLRRVIVTSFHSEEINAIKRIPQNKQDPGCTALRFPIQFLSVLAEKPNMWSDIVIEDDDDVTTFYWSVFFSIVCCNLFSWWWQRPTSDILPGGSSLFLQTHNLVRFATVGFATDRATRFSLHITIICEVFFIVARDQAL